MLSEFEMKRIEKVVGAFIEIHRPPTHLRKKMDLGFRVKGQSVEIFEVRPLWDDENMHEFSVAKITYVKTQKIWKLYWQRQDLKWHGYDPLPEVSTLEEAITEIDADPYDCFWS